MIRGPMTHKRCCERGHKQTSYKYQLDGTKKAIFWLNCFCSNLWQLMNVHIFYRPPWNPRKNITQAWPTKPSTPKSINPDNIIFDSSCMLTRRQMNFFKSSISLFCFPFLYVVYILCMAHLKLYAGDLQCYMEREAQLNLVCHKGLLLWIVL